MTQKKENEQTLDNALRMLLMGRKAGTQEDICVSLEKLGYEVNQSKVSRLLRKIGAIKVVGEKGQIIYSLAREPAPPSLNTPMKDLVLAIKANEALVVIFTSPGCASLVARLLDYNQMTTEILGSIAGDDTIFVAPKSIRDIHKLLEEVKRLLS